MTELQSAPPFDWASNAYAALHSPTMDQQQDKWSAFSNPAAMPTHAFTIPPSLLTGASIERYGQVTPPDERSPADLPRNQRESSIPVEQLRNETAVWPASQQQTGQLLPSPPQESEPSPKRRRTSRLASSNHNHGLAPPHQPMDDANPQPPKRKRGRPKSQPQMVEAYTADGFPFQVSSARQTHLEKNRVAAHKCRQRKKEYINSLEDRAHDFSAKNKMLKENVALLRDEVLGLKNEVLRHAGCGFWAVDEYLARCAGDLLGMEAPRTTMRLSSSRHSNTQQSPAMSTSHLTGQKAREVSESVSSTDMDDFGGLELLKDFTDEDMDDMEL